MTNSHSGLITLTVDQQAHSVVPALLLDYLPEEHVRHASLFEELSAEEIRQQFSPEGDEPTMAVNLRDGKQLTLSTKKIGLALQQRIRQLEELGASAILLLSNVPFPHLNIRDAALLTPHRIIPPLIAAIADGNQVGVVVADKGEMNRHASPWQHISPPPCFAVACPARGDLVEAGLRLQEQGAEVVVLDGMAYQKRDGDMLQKLLGIPVLLSGVLVATLAAELVI